MTDGPFAETKEQIGGFILIEAKDLDEAIELPGTERNPIVKQFQQLAVAVSTVRLGISWLSGITKRRFRPYCRNSENVCLGQLDGGPVGVRSVLDRGRCSRHH